jgi:FtsP/CotA-like multicopper oxidase with cupredoxin domain
MRAYEFVADEPGDWALHCHKSHHTMNAMGHSVKTFIGVQKRDLVNAIRRVASPDYMPMATAGMADMAEMEMPMPDNTLPMMTGFGQFGPIEMGGMFTVVKVREGLARDDYKDPGWYKNPPGTVAYEVKGEMLPEAPRAAPNKQSTRPSAELSVVKPRANSSNHRHR